MRTAIKTIDIYNPYVNNNGSFNKIGTFPITDSCERSAVLMGDDYIKLVFKSTEYYNIPAFSFIRLENGVIDKTQTFFLMNDYHPMSEGSEITSNGVEAPSYAYEMKFYSVGNMLRKPICYRHVKVDTYEWDEPEITVSADLSTMYVVIMESIASYATRLESNLLFRKMIETLPINGLTTTSGMTTPSSLVKLTADTELSTFSFKGACIANVCTSVANQFTDEKKETEWYIEEFVNQVTGKHELLMHFTKCEDLSTSMSIVSDFTARNEGDDKYVKPYITGGLSKVEYSRDTSNIPQEIIPYGSERNMSNKSVKGIDVYTQMQSTFGKRLRLDYNHSCEIDGVTYEHAYAVVNSDNETIPLFVNSHGGLLNDKVNTGVERVEYFDKVYPQCHFAVTKVDVRQKKRDDSLVPEYTCTAIAVNEDGSAITPMPAGLFPLQIEEGTTLSVRFESGYLNGREFEIANKSQRKINPITGQPEDDYSLRFTIVADGSIEDGTLIPSGSFIPVPRDENYPTSGYEGDRFALFNMKMPDSYITVAQQELAQKAYEKLVEYQDTLPDMKCTAMPRDFAQYYMGFGVRFNVHSEKIGFEEVGGARRPIDFISRVTAFSYKLTDPNAVSFTLSSSIVRGTLAEMANSIATVTNAASGLGQTTRNLSRRGWRDASEMADMVDSLAAQMMLIGDEEWQFAVTSTIDCQDANNVSSLDPNSGNFDHLHFSYGQLQHTQSPYTDYANGGVWEISQGDYNQDNLGDPLDADTPYYVYAQCSSNTTTAQIFLCAEEQDSESMLLLGILSSEYDGKRVFSRTNGYTAIAGGTITTEQIQDANRQLIIDFSSNPPRIIAVNGAEIYGNIKFKSLLDEDGHDATNIGGDNLLFVNNLNKSHTFDGSGSDGIYEEVSYYSVSGNTTTHTLHRAGKYVFSAKNVDYGAQSDRWDTAVALCAINSSGVESKRVLLPKGKISGIVIETTEPCYFAIFLVSSTQEPNPQATDAYVEISEMQLQFGERATNYAAFVNHLVGAIKGTTDINGGLLMTNVLMLKDANDDVTAGMSGLKTENILMWGGADYEGALNASDQNNDYYTGPNKTGTRIATLLKRDGTGKIGVFFIEEDKVEIKTDYGTVVLDDDEGLIVKDSNDKEKVIVTPNSIADVISDAGTGGEDSVKSQISKSDVPASDVKDIDSYIGDMSAQVSADGVIVSADAQTFDIIKDTNTIKLTMNFDGAIYGKDSLENPMNVPELDLTISLIRVVEGQEIVLPDPPYFTLMTNISTLDAQQLPMQTLTWTNVQQGTYKFKITPTGLNPSWSGNITFWTFRVLASLTYDNIDPKTVVGKDGMVSIWSNRAMFAVKNEQSKQIIYAKGIPTADPAVVGQLYTQSMMVNGVQRDVLCISNG